MSPGSKLAIPAQPVLSQNEPPSSSQVHICDLLCTAEATSRVLPPVLGSTDEETQGTIGEGPMEGCEEDDEELQHVQ